MGNVADKLGKLAQTKADIRAAIMEKGQAVEETDPFAVYPEKIRAISGGDQINQAREVQVVAANQIQVGDTVYTISGKYAPVIKGNENGVALDVVNCAAFSPNGKLLVLGGQFAGYAKVYSVSGTTVTYVCDIKADAADAALSALVYSAAFSPDGNTLVLGGQFAGYAKVYSVSGTTVTYVDDIKSDAVGTALSQIVHCVAFSPDGAALVLGLGYGAKVYSVDTTSINFISDITANGSSSIMGSVRSITFSPDGTTLVLVGTFNDYAKVYSVSGTSITYVGNLKADAAGATISRNVYSAIFSPDGTKLVLGGHFKGSAKMYSVSGTTVTYVCDIKADAVGTELYGIVMSAIFSPDGTKLVIGGQFTGYAKVYSVSGTTVAYVDDIKADAVGTALNNIANSAIFSPDGTILVLGGGFPCYAVQYSIVDGIPMYVEEGKDSVYKGIDGMIPHAVSANFNPTGFGYARADISEGEEGTVVLIGKVSQGAQEPIPTTQ